MRIIPLAIAAGLFVAGLGLGWYGARIHFRNDVVAQGKQEIRAASKIAIRSRQAGASIAPVKQTASVNLADLRRAIANMCVWTNVRSSGTSRIWGRVVDGRGIPVSGACITAWVDRDSLPLSEVQTNDVPDEEETIDTEKRMLRLVTETVSNYFTTPAREVITATDSNGNYEFVGLVDGSYVLNASKPQHEIMPSYPVTATDMEVNFTAARKVPIRCTVEFPNEVAPQSALISALALNHGHEDEGTGNATFVWFKSDPFIRLVPGRYEITARAGSYRQPASIVVDVDADPQWRTNLCFRLFDVTGLVVRVASPGSDWASRVVLSATNVASDQAKQNGVWIGRDGSGQCADNTATNPAILFPHLTPGMYRIDASIIASDKCLATKMVAITNGLSFTDLEMVSPARNECVVVWVFGPTNQLLNDVSFRIADDSPWDGVSSRDWVRNRDGSFTVALPGGNKVGYDRARNLELEVTSDAYGEKTIEIMRTAAPECLVRFEEPASLQVEQTRLSGRYRSDLKATLVATNSATEKEYEEFFADGSAIFKTISPGEYVLTILLDYVPIKSVPLTLKSGHNTAEIDLPALHDVVVFVENMDPGGVVVLERAGELSGPRSLPSLARIGENRFALFSQVPPGNYIVSCDAPWLTGKMSITVNEDLIIRLDVNACLANAFCLQTLGHGDRASIGLRVGDIIVGADGRAFKGTILMWVLWELTLMKRVTLSVLRGDAMFEVSATAQELEEFLDHNELVPCRVDWE